MSVTTTVDQLQYAGAGSVGPFPVTFPFIAPGDLEVTTVDTLGNVAELVYPRDYSVSGGAVLGSSIPQTGSITLTNALTSGWSMTIDRGNMLSTQPLSLPTSGQLPAKSLEAAFDRLTLLVQQLMADGARGAQVPATDPIAAQPLTLPALAKRMVAGALLGFDPTSGAPIISTPSFTTTNLPVAGIVQVVDTVALLKALAAPSSAVTYLVRGYLAANDGGGGTFRWNSADAAADDGGTKFQLNAGGNGRFERLFTGRINAQWFGVVGTGDITAALQAAANFFASGQGALYIPAAPANGKWLVTSTITFAFDQVRVVGDGQDQTVINFAPTASGVCFLFKKTGSEFFRSAVRDIGFYSADTTYTKTAIDCWDCSNFTVERCHIQPWSGNSNTCVGIRTRGRELFCAFNNNIAADIPIQHSVSPNTSLVNCDHFLLLHNYLIANANPCVLCDDGTLLTNYTIDGCAMVKGTYGFYRSDTTSGYASYNVRFTNIRTEQGTVGADYSIYMVSTVETQQEITFDNIQLDPTRAGIYVSKSDRVMLRGVQYGGSGVGLYVDNLNTLSLSGCYFPAACTVTLGSTTPLYPIWQDSNAVSSQPIPGNGLYQVAQHGATNPEGAPPFVQNGTNCIKLSGTLATGTLLKTPSSNETGRKAAIITVAVYGATGPIAESGILSDCLGANTGVASVPILLAGSTNFVAGTSTPSSGKIGWLAQSGNSGLYNNMGSAVSYVITITWI